MMRCASAIEAKYSFISGVSLPRTGADEATPNRKVRVKPV